MKLKKKNTTFLLGWEIFFWKGTVPSKSPYKEKWLTVVAQRHADIISEYEVCISPKLPFAKLLTRKNIWMSRKWESDESPTYVLYTCLCVVCMGLCMSMQFVDKLFTFRLFFIPMTLNYSETSKIIKAVSKLFKLNSFVYMEE